VKKHLTALLVSIGLILVLVLSACAPAAEVEVVEKVVEKTVTQTVEVEKEYRCLNPQGDQLPVEITALAPRLDTIVGKKIYVKQGEADPVIMPALAERLEKDYPDTEWVYYNPESSFGTNTPEADVLADADAVIRGIGW